MRLRFLWLAAVLLVSAVPAGADADLAFWRDLSEKEVATWGDAVLLGAALRQADRPVTGFTEAEKFLQESGLLSGIVIRPAAAPLRRGTTALLFLRLVEIRGGFWYRLLPNSERYAHREAVFQGLMAAEKSAMFISGAELVSIFTRAQDYQIKNHLLPGLEEPAPIDENELTVETQTREAQERER